MRNRKREGTGLGLALAKKIAQLMGGDIEVRSEYNVGSCFTARINQRICNDDSEELRREAADKYRNKTIFLYENDLSKSPASTQASAFYFQLLSVLYAVLTLTDLL